MKKSITIFVSFCLLASVLLVNVSPIQAGSPGGDEILIAPPLVLTTVPPNAVAGVAIDAGIVVVFDESMDTTGGQEPAVAQTSAAPTATFSFGAWSTTNVADDTATFTHDGGTNWDELQAVTVQVTGGQNVGGANAYVENLIWGFTVGDFTAPTVLLTTPANTDSGVAIDAGIVVVFDESMDTTGGQEPAVAQTSAAPTATFSFGAWSTTNVADDTATFTHDGGTNWNELQAVTVQVTGGQDVAVVPNAYAEDLSWGFTVGDFTAPTVLLTTPANTDSGVAIDAGIVVVFDESMDTTGGQEPAVAQTSAAPTATFSFGAWSTTNVADDTATFTHDGGTNWNELQAVTVQVTGGQDDAVVPNAYAEDLSWGFTVGDFTAPTVLLTTPANTDSGVAIDAGIVVVFDESMDTTGGQEPAVAQTSAAPTATFSFGAWSTTNVADDTATFTHDGGTNWNELQAVTVQVTGGQDVAVVPNAYAEDLSWGFTVGDFTLPVVSNLTYVPDAGVSVNNPVQIDFKVNETYLAGAGVMFFTFVEDDVALNVNNYTRIIEYHNSSGVVTIEHDASPGNESMYNASMAWDATCPSIANDSVGGYFLDGVLADKYISAEPFWNITDAKHMIGVDVFFTNATYPAGVNAHMQFLASGAVNGIMIDGTVWMNATNIANGTFHANATVQHRLSYISIDKTTGLRVGGNMVMVCDEKFNLSLLGFTVDQMVPSGEYWIIAYGEDNSTNTGYNMSETSFRVDHTAPTVTSIVPANGTIDITLAEEIVITFNEAMDNTTVTYTCVPATTGWVESWDATNTILTLTHANFTESTDYLFTVTAGEDDSGNAMVDESEVNFTTGEFTGPTVTPIPADGATGINIIAGNYTLEFNEAMDTSVGTIVTNLPGVGAAAVVWSWDATGIWYNGTYSALAELTKYYVNLTGFEDVPGNALTGDTNFNFTTGEFTGPTIVSTTPADAATDVALAAGTYVIEFSEPMTTTGTPLSNLPGVSWAWEGGIWFNGTYTVLSTDTTYYVNLTGQGFEDLAGNALTGDTYKDFTTLAAAATGTVTGQVVDADGNGIEGATVTVGALSDTTNETGWYVIEDVPLGPQTLTITHPDYEDQTVDVTVVEDQTTTGETSVMTPPAGNDYTMMIILLIVILAIVGAVAFMMMRKPSTPKPPAKEEPEPPTEEETPPETLETPETTPIEESPPETLEAPETTPTEQPPVE